MTELEYKLAKAIIDGCIGSSESGFTVEVEDGNTFVSASVYCHIEGYTEDDYYNGTGAYVVTDVNVGIDDVEVHTYTDDGDETPNSIELDTTLIERYVMDALAA